MMLQSEAIDTMSRRKALTTMIESHIAAISTAKDALADIDTAADIVATALTRGSALFYAAAGSSGLMALADASELPGTFGIAQSQIKICMAGGVPVDGSMPGSTEDDTAQAKADARNMCQGDVAIVISASGTTPYALAFADTARTQGNTVIAIANVAGAPLFDHADVAIALPTAREVVDGSTRLGAGTVQKVALNMMSTQAGVLMGHVHDGLMVNLKPDNIKLRQRATLIVAKVADVSQKSAQEAFEKAAFDTKLAVLIARGVDIGKARQMLNETGGHLRDCLAKINTKTTT